jgi:hypothetical protein
MPGSNSETRGRFCDDLGTKIVAQYSAGLIITLHGRFIAMEYVNRSDNQVHPMIQTLFPNNDAVFQAKMPPTTQLELFNHCLKSMKVNFNIFHNLHNHLI